MGKRAALWIAALALTGVASIGIGQVGPRGYLGPGTFDILAVLPPAPVTGDARDQADRAIFRATRRMVGTPRWDMATNDVKLAPVDMLRDFNCAVGVTMTPDTAPRVVALVTKAAFDASRSSGTAKDFYKRPRPYLVNKVDSAAICQPAERLKTSYDYPSGHATLGWTWATLLTRIAPDRATAILARGRAFGESRIVCGVHNASAVDAGRTTASATLAAVQSDPAFLADLDAARSELASLQNNPKTPRPAEQACAVEGGLVAERVY